MRGPNLSEGEGSEHSTGFLLLRKLVFHFVGSSVFAEVVKGTRGCSWAQKCENDLVTCCLFVCRVRAS